MNEAKNVLLVEFNGSFQRYMESDIEKNVFFRISRVQEEIPEIRW